MLKKVLIIGYFFPPCNLTAGQRVQGWADHLIKSGYYPTIVTRNWDMPVSTPADVLKSSGKQIKYFKYNSYEVYYLPHREGIRDTLYIYLSNSKLQKLSKLITFFNLIAENFTSDFIPHYNILKVSKKILQDNNDIDKLIITANPFNLFLFGYILNKKFKIPWIADYRDDWNTSEITKSINYIINYLQKRSERKWVGSASFITSVSTHYVDKISTFTGRPGQVLLNGFELNYPSTNKDLNPNTFTITYNGSLYGTQAIEIFLSAIENLIITGKSPLPIEVKFPGLAFDPAQTKRVLDAAKNITSHIFITERLPKEEVIKLQLSSDLLLMVAHSNVKGIPSSKLYEYIGLKKPILLCPSDNDIIEETIKTVSTGYFAKTIDECEEVILELIQKKISGKPLLISRNDEAGELFSRANQAKVLAGLLDKI